MNITERPSRRPAREPALVALVAAASLLVAYAVDNDTSSATTTPTTTSPATTMPGHGTDHDMDPADRAAAMLRGARIRRRR